MITNPPAVPISVTSLAVEVSTGCTFDYLIVNGVRYCGMPTVSLEGVVPDGTPIEWRTDSGKTTAGWELCFPPPPEDDSYETYDYDSDDDGTKATWKAIKKECEDKCRDEGQESEIGCQIKCYLVG